MKPLLRKVTTAALSAALLLSTAAVSTAAAEGVAGPSIECASAASGQGPFYPGPSASHVYDKAFGKGPAVPELGSSTPQGLATWTGWDGAGKDLLLVTSYGKSGKDALIIGIDPKTGAHVGTVAIAESHVGGIAVSKGWAFVQGRPSGSTPTIRKYKLTELRDAMKKSGTPYLKQTGEAQKVTAASFLTADGGTLYAGKFSETGRGTMQSYQVGDDGSLTEQKTYEVPMKTQGLMVTKDHFVYSTSYGRTNRSNLYVVDKGATDIDIPSTECYRAPSMTEGIAQYGDQAFLLFESGSYQYPDARNVIKNLHKGTVSAVTNP
ncbi:hypothetical protein SAMN05421805_103350 [Saccharopolyspora antimicrobica]|uniref:Uncharacterized protein n=1 Tax=Saccharopolyspora antimicrobica TaxID=455193 RepID=A0A1I4XB67_9PSEU|nr:hypothetical protein [Saccharopolyspora antimicrobica]RKT84419.1 hypothetical protein ATL45_2734 [Saccharopolyspora antimicrobica]SFN23035.1 hypothetical protein SAMN05421805_103350 [Saccharopolyspora antimicrobica]